MTPSQLPSLKYIRSHCAFESANCNTKFFILGSKSWIHEYMVLCKTQWSLVSSPVLRGFRLLKFKHNHMGANQQVWDMLVSCKFNGRCGVWAIGCSKQAQALWFWDICVYVLHLSIWQIYSDKITFKVYILSVYSMCTLGIKNHTLGLAGAMVYQLNSSGFVRWWHCETLQWQTLEGTVYTPLGTRLSCWILSLMCEQRQCFAGSGLAVGRVSEWYGEKMES